MLLILARGSWRGHLY